MELPFSFSVSGLLSCSITFRFIEVSTWLYDSVRGGVDHNPGGQVLGLLVTTFLHEYLPNLLAHVWTRLHSVNVSFVLFTCLNAFTVQVSSGVTTDLSLVVPSHQFYHVGTRYVSNFFKLYFIRLHRDLEFYIGLKHIAERLSETIQTVSKLDMTFSLFLPIGVSDAECGAISSQCTVAPGVLVRVLGLEPKPSCCSSSGFWFSTLVACP